MPAVKTFALYSTVAIFLDFIFQITAFVALMSIDHQRFKESRFDIFCCFTSQAPSSIDSQHGFLHKIMEKYYKPFLFSKLVYFTYQTRFSLNV